MELAAAGQSGGGTGRARVLLLARAPGADPVRPQLADLIGPERSVKLEEMLLQRAAHWAAETAPGRLHIAYEPGHSEDAVRELVGGEGASLFPLTGEGESQRVLAAAERVFGAGEGPVLIAWPDLPQWRPAHAAGALSDLRDGCGVSVGPVFDGGFYLLALARLEPSLFELPDDGWRGPEAMGRMLTAAHAAHLDAGLLRAERGLRTPADLRAAVADPLLDPELRRLLR